MLRRDFLKYISAVAAMTLLPSSAKATESYSGPLWIFIQAIGGWDPTSLCDPKGYSEGESNPVNKCFKRLEIQSNKQGMRYPKFLAENGLSQDSAASANSVYKQFFEQNGDKLLVVNGIDTQTNGHSAGQRYMMSGRLAEGYPALSALIAGINMPTSPLSFISAGGYDETDGIVSSTRLSNTNAINELAYVNRYYVDDEGKVFNYQNASVFEKIQAARKARQERLKQKVTLASLEDKLEQFGLAHSGSNELAKLVEYIPEDINTHPDRNNKVFSQGRFAMAGYKAGLSVSVNIQTGGFDTHGNHDARHIPNLTELLKGVLLLQEEAKNQGISDKVVFVIGSDFGRTPGYNGGNGKDHWSVSSMMFMGEGIKGGRVIGETTPTHDVKKVNPTTLQADSSGISITYGHINKALRKLAGIENNSLIQQYYPLDSALEELNLFG